jgi:PPOX class probable F420-dependent enzyme
MPSRRDLIAMTPDEISAYMRAQHRVMIVTNGPNGMPHPMPMNFGVDDADRVFITTFRKSQKVKNLERDPRASLLFESGIAYEELKSVILYADAEIIADPAHIRDALRQIRGEAQMPTGDADWEQQVADSFTKRVVVRFTPFRTISWDHSKLSGKY